MMTHTKYVIGILLQANLFIESFRIFKLMFFVDNKVVGVKSDITY